MLGITIPNFFSIFLHEIMRIINICTIFVSSYNNIKFNKTLPMSYIFAIIMLAALFKTLNS